MDRSAPQADRQDREPFDMHDSANRVIAYVESDGYLGHAETQCHQFVSAMLSLGWKVLLLAFDAGRSEKWISGELPHFAGNVHVVPLSGNTGGRGAPERWRRIRSLIREGETATGWTVDLAFLTWFDGLAPSRREVRSCLGTLFCPWVGMYFFPVHLRLGTAISLSGRIRRIYSDCRLFRQKGCRGIAVLDEGVATPLRWIGGGKPVVVFPEATDNRVLVTDGIRQVRTQAGGRPIVGLLGVLSARKGVLNFLRAAAGIDAGEAFFLMAGELDRSSFSPSEWEELTRLIGNLGRGNGSFHLHRIDRASEFNGYFDLCDVHCLVYGRFYHSSGLLAKAAAFGKPVIVARGHCMGERVEKYGLGMTVAENDPDGMRRAIRHLIRSEARERLGSAGGFAAYSAFNGPERLKASLEMLCGPR